MQLMENMKKETEVIACIDIADVIESIIESMSFNVMSDDIFISSLYESDDVLNSKLNLMKSNFAYLFDVLSNGSMNFIDPNICILDIHFIYTEPFNLCTKNEPRILNISKDITLEERREFEKILTKYSKVFAQEYNEMPSIDRDIAQHYISIKEGHRPVKKSFKE